MFSADIVNIFQWWATIFVVGSIFLPITTLIFPNFVDKGYVFARIIGIAFVSYAVFILGFLKIIPFTNFSIFLTISVFLVLNIVLIFKYPSVLTSLKQPWRIFLLEECLFLGILILWSFIHAHQPDIHGLEKYMDYGFINSILRARYFPPLDMWFTPYFINYYYFGHLVTAILTKLSFLPSTVTFNLMLSTMAAIGFTASFSIAVILLKFSYKSINSKIPIIGGLISAFLLNFAGNLHTIYLFFKPYQNENPVPFWQLIFSPSTYPNSYWYPNATRFIHNTIHEFPIYSNVVSDLHGHFLDIPFVLLTIAVLLSLFLKSKLKIGNWKLEIPLISFLLAIMYMTNAWDGMIYLILASLIVMFVKLKSIINLNHKQSIKYYVSSIMQNKKYMLHATYYILLIFAGLFLFSLPFNLNFKPFASGIGLLCAPKFLTDMGKLGPFLFEPNHCQHSPLWQLGILYGFFYFWIISFGIFIYSKIKSKYFNITQSDVFVGILIILSTILIVIPEFIYVKDIYPAHYRANTMFKLVYQSFMMLSLCSGYIIVRLFLDYRFLILNRWYWKFIYWIAGLTILTLVSLYPYFAINSYFGDLKNYSGLNGANYLRSLYPDDYQAIVWINKNIKGQPIILEAQGDSYTDYARVSTNTGLPTVLGWTVHEWLWRGTYDIPAPRIPEIKTMYESQNLKDTKILLNKYKVSFVFVGSLEWQKYPNLNEEKFKILGKIIYQKGDTKIFEINTK
jgi:YYY domain-containing protein